MTREHGETDSGVADPAMVLVAHGTRNPRGVEMIAALAEAVSERVATVRVAFVDVLGPSPSEVLASMDGEAVVVPAFLASGYHVHTDVPREVAGFDGVEVTSAMGPDPALARVLALRLREAGWQPGDAVVLAAAGSSDARALHDVRRAAGLLADRVGSRVSIGYVATGEPRVADVVTQLRAAGEQRVFVASYLLAHGLFHERLAHAGADGVAAPLGLHTEIVDLLVSRYHAGASRLARVRAA
ncbi:MULTISPECIES: sirohydrochlorin chelatase [Antrihabitans]|jgi:sirohydrochlorin ferrochelatase|uniref:Sirohydrochlorin chelatase n=2 Tax=Antrihabitans TaxID=2799491 RepID=A0A934U2Q4_9NOCA|nr:sirohydrochlorin chelatase [Antrihabitans stalagmiti]MBJ8338343.1 sirohydrochlorin chelatase [Antrihabitans stalagmiti]